MPNLLSSLTSAAGALGTYQKAMEVVQNDTVNVNTPGFVRQSVSFQSLPFDVNGASPGGVTLNGTLSSRDEYAEYNVQTQQTAYSMSSTIYSHLSNLQPLFDLQSTTGVAGSLNTLFSTFSQLSVSPNDAQARQSVINAASGLATSFNVAANQLSSGGSAIDKDTTSAISDFNNILADLRNLNVELRADSKSAPDPSLDARVHVDLQNLSQYAGISSYRAQDGSITVSLGGQKPLLVGSTAFPLKVVTSSTGSIIEDSNGNDVTNAVSGGKLGALLQMRNTTLPGYQSQLDQLAQSLATTVNGKLAAGIDQNSAAGAPLFSYSAAAPAVSFAVTSITSSQIAAATVGSPGGNDNAIALSSLQNQVVPALGNFTLTQYFGNLSSVLGRDISNAQNNQTTQQQLLAQAQSLRAQNSSVSLDEEAARLIEYQQSYDATSKLITVLDNLTQTLLALIPNQ